MKTMKKIYLLSSALVLCGSMMAQTNATAPNAIKRHAGPLAPTSRVIHTGAPVSGMRSPDFTQWIEVVGDVMTNKGITLGAGLDENNFLDLVNCDSTVKVSDPSGSNFAFDNLLGTVLDPKSEFLTGGPLVTASEQYYLDSLAIRGSYVKVNGGITDTLFVWVVWGDTTSASSTFLKRNNSDIWLPPIADWRDRIIGPKVTGAGAAQGNVIKANAAAGNMRLIKYVLTDADSVTEGGFSKIIMIPLPDDQITIPANNLVACYYTFVPGSVPAVGSIAYSFTGGEPQTVNGFSGIVWNQETPTVTGVSDYQNYQVDPTSWCMGINYNKNQRYALYPAAYTNSLFGDLTSSPTIFYNLSNVFTGIHENENNFSLFQNQPNPFSDNTTINYQLSKSANSVSLAVYDVRGVKVYENVDTNQKQGRYTVNIDTKFTPGVYFYTLTVDGSRVTRKMIAQ